MNKLSLYVIGHRLAWDDPVLSLESRSRPIDHTIIAARHIERYKAAIWALSADEKKVIQRNGDLWSWAEHSWLAMSLDGIYSIFTSLAESSAPLINCRLLIAVYVSYCSNYDDGMRHEGWFSLWKVAGFGKTQVISHKHEISSFVIRDFYSSSSSLL